MDVSFMTERILKNCFCFFFFRVIERENYNTVQRTSLLRTIPCPVGGIPSL